MTKTISNNNCFVNEIPFVEDYTWQRLGDILNWSYTLKWASVSPRGNLYLHAVECDPIPTQLIPAIRDDLRSRDKHMMLDYGYVAFKTQAELAHFLLRWTGTFDMKGNPQ